MHVQPAGGFDTLTFAAAQLQAIGFSKFRNFWSDVHDFTPSSDSWSFLSEASSAGLPVCSVALCICNARTFLHRDIQLGLSYRMLQALMC